jgi:hypothetical protein
MQPWSLFVVVCLLAFFEAGSHWVAQAGLKLTILLSASAYWMLGLQEYAWLSIYLFTFFIYFCSAGDQAQGLASAVQLSCTPNPNPSQKVFKHSKYACSLQKTLYYVVHIRNL